MCFHSHIQQSTVKFGMGVHGRHKINFNDYADTLTFRLPPPSGQMFHLYTTQTLNGQINEIYWTFLSQRVSSGVPVK